jgi:hypothetical protein
MSRCGALSSEFTAKAGKIQGDSEEFALRLSGKFCDLRAYVASFPKHIFKGKTEANALSLNAAWRAAQGRCAPSPQAHRQGLLPAEPLEATPSYCAAGAGRLKHASAVARPARS